MLPGHRRRGGSAQERPVPLFRRCAKRPNLRPMHESTRQRICGIPALRRWNSALSLATPSHLHSDVRHLIRHLPPDVQVMGRAQSHQHRRHVCSTIHPQRDLYSSLPHHATPIGHEYARRPLATRPYRVRPPGLHLWSGAPLRVQ